MTPLTAEPDPGTRDRPGRTQRRRWVLLWSGLLCIGIGLALLGYAAWQMVGTNILSERLQRETVAELEQSWEQPVPATGDSSVDVGPGDAFALVRIPRFGSDYVMPVLEGVDDESLERGFGHFPHSAGPGEDGNFALAAHRITHGEPLRDLPDLRPGDTVVVETRETVFTYVIDTDPEDLVVGFDDVWVVADHPVNPDPGGVGPADEQRLLTMTTCAELFHTDDRMVVFGHLVSSGARD